MPQTDFTKAFPPVEREIWALDDGTWCFDQSDRFWCWGRRNGLFQRHNLGKPLTCKDNVRSTTELEADGWETVYSSGCKEFSFRAYPAAGKAIVFETITVDSHADLRLEIGLTKDPTDREAER